MIYHFSIVTVNLHGEALVNRECLKACRIDAHALVPNRSIQPHAPLFPYYHLLEVASILPTQVHYAASRMQMSAFLPRPLSLVTIFPRAYSTCITLGVSLTSTSTKPAGW